MLGQYLPVVLAFLFAGLVVAGVFGLSALLGRGRLRPERKRDTFESGMPLIDSSRKRVPIKFFVVAMVFIVFDIEVAFLFPWAVTLRESMAFNPWHALISGFVFLVLLAVGYVYLWREGVFDWGKRGSAS
jgi:NADH-quinone oxidoreductase subunit A